VVGGLAAGQFIAHFNGQIDEPSMYNRALSDSEIQAIYNASISGKCGIAPAILAQPQGQRVKPGTNVTFTVSARGTALSYHWRLEGADLAGATNSSLVLSNVQPTMAGNYSVRVTNSLGTATSSNAMLKVDVVFAFGNGQPLTNSMASFSGPVTIQLTNVYTNGYIFYTLDGSEPSFYSSQYTATFVVTQAVVLRALGYNSDFFQSGQLDPVTILIPPSYTLTTNTAGGGSVSLNPSGGYYLSNTIVTVTATPAGGWTFLQWAGDLTGTGATNTVTMSRNKFVQAIFGTTLSTTVAGGGSVVLNPSGGIYPYGTIVWLSAIPQPGNVFGLWGNAGSGNVNPLSFGVTNPNPTISSLFGPVSGGQAALTVVPVGSGRISVNPRANSYTLNTTVTITATADSGQSFTGWSGDASGMQNPLSVTMSANKLIYANFTHGSSLSTRASYEGAKPEGFVFTLKGDYGAKYEIDGSTNLVTWTNLSTVTDMYGTMQFTDSGATNLSRRFYRAVLLP